MMMFESSVFCLLLLPRKQQQFFDTFFRGGISLLVLFSNNVKEKKKKTHGRNFGVVERDFGCVWTDDFGATSSSSKIPARQKKDTVQ